MKEKVEVMADPADPSAPWSSKSDVEESAPGEVDDHEVFRVTADGVQFRTLGWPMASVIFLKRTPTTTHDFAIHLTDNLAIVMFATGVLSIPGAMYELGK